MEEKSAVKLLKSGVTKKRRIVFKQKYGTITLREYDNIQCDGSVVVEGFTSSSLTPILVANYLADQLELPLIGDILCDDFPPRAVVNNGQIQRSVRILGDQRIVVFLCEFSFAKADITNSIIEALLDFSARHKCSNLLSVEGIPKSFVERELTDRERLIKAENEKDGKIKPKEEEKKVVEPKKGKAKTRKLSDDDDDSKKDEKDVFTVEERKKIEERIGSSILYVTNNEDLDKKLYSHGCVPFGNGLVDGITGGLLCEMVESASTVTVFMVSADMRYPDASSAVTVLQCIHHLYPDIKIDLKPLADKAKFLQNAINKMNRSIQEEHNKPIPGMYT